MKRITLYIIIGVLTACIVVETYIISNQNNSINSLNIQIDKLTSTNTALNKSNTELSKKIDNKDKELATKVIIQTYKEFSKAGKAFTKDKSEYEADIQTVNNNMVIISNSYNGNDEDIKDMLIEMKNFLSLNLFSRSLQNYTKAKFAIEKCISKYALFDKVGLK